ncbi:DEAD/DEAH box helicase [Agaribacterium sp. ZY112]|uniref:DEAD/DEAH box helicase n=1 Tax=Agaribacterium sp. ZY112 TaxID=3233574 RepID=UPI003526828A
MSDSTPTFTELGLNEHILKALSDVGYETPSPIQAQSLPPLLEGRDILGQAQTGTGKTAAFALPILQQVDLKQKSPQVLVLAPTRELAIQVAEAFQSYARYIKGFHILPVYGGQSYEGQIRALKRGVHVVVGTPGRVMDHMRKGTLKLDGLKHLVLDEADEMLRMGFIDDVEWVMSHTPENRQIALFSATMPREIEKVANTYLQDPVHVKIEVKTTTADTIRQRYWQVGGINKMDALTRILEAEEFDAVIIFVRTKTATVELAEKLEARGHSSAALNGDISQALRERTVDKLKNGKIDILIATDVAARGLDVTRISHVINYDIPYDTEAYVHRIGRTGRAGRSGDAILFVMRRETRMLRQIERATNKRIEEMQLPSTEAINEQRVARFKQKIGDTISNQDTEFYKQMIADFQSETEFSALDIAAAMASLSQGGEPFLLEDRPEPKRRERSERGERGEREGRGRDRRERDSNMQTYRIAVGRRDGITPGNIVGAIANEANMDSNHIGHIKLFDNFSLVDLPKGMPDETFKVLQNARVCNRAMRLSIDDGPSGGGNGRPKKRWKDGDGPRKGGKSKKFKARD